MSVWWCCIIVLHVTSVYGSYFQWKVKKLYVADKSSSHADSLQNHRKSSSKSSSSLKQESSSRNSSTMKDSSSVKDSEDTDPSRVKTLCDSPDHISAKLNQRVLSADHSVVTSNIASSVASDDSSSSNNTESSSLTTTTVHRPKTVKTLGSKTMRSTGKQSSNSLLRFPHGVTLYCDSLLTASFSLQRVWQRNDETDNFYMLPLNIFVCFVQFIMHVLLQCPQ